LNSTVAATITGLPSSIPGRHTGPELPFIDGLDGLFI
jgi:hypothetical protein